ncbi:hypothetical protein C8R44DRAFT_166420 [Mycena epipterygia]|nr:hypothetical protein C8R44DRAFT_166420 [Mycena epipterygia]
METTSPLDIQELVDKCTEFLRDSRPDLMACSLVSRSWAHAAQRHLFWNVSIEEQEESQIPLLWARLQETLHASPHLIRHIHRLRIHIHCLPTDALSIIDNFSFTNLTHVVIRGGLVPIPSVLAIQKPSHSATRADTRRF